MAQSPDDPDLTQLLRQWRERPDDPEPAGRVAAAVYAQLKRLASNRLRNEAHTLSGATDLVHEAWLRLDPAAVELESRLHFFRLASLAMRSVLVDRARARLAQKRGGGAERVSLRWAQDHADFDDARLLDLAAALERLQRDHPRHADVVQLRCFGGLELTEVAAALGVSLATVKRDWRFATAWLTDAMADRAEPVP